MKKLFQALVLMTGVAIAAPPPAAADVLVSIALPGLSVVFGDPYPVAYYPPRVAYYPRPAYYPVPVYRVRHHGHGWGHCKHHGHGGRDDD